MPTLFELYQNIIRESPFAQANEVALRALLCEIQGLIEMSDFYLKKDEEIKDLPTFLSYLARFLNGEPYQYIIQKARFINRDFFVDNRVLIPRMETEEVVYKAIELIRDSNNSSSLSIADLGSGSGIIAITLKKTFPHSQVFASDTSKDAIAVAKINAEKFGADISFFRGDVLEPFIFSGIKLDFLISNPPYITNIQEIDSGVIKYEPYSALVDKDELG
ncbi:MAG: HemK family protein methyltransferase, partial [Epsilonproteobacteria bacterium]|nr:HemK family protein methyltransferase [Campylobacterota bacterium]